MPNLPPDLSAWLDEMEAYCKFNCDHLNPEEPSRHCFVWAEGADAFKERNIWNPYAPFCTKCRKSVRQLFGELARFQSDLPRAIQVIRGLVEVLDGMIWQFAYTGVRDGVLHLGTGGLSALEDAFDALGYPDPKPCPERECQMDGCHEDATCGTPTPNGYKRVCGTHFRALQEARDERT